MSEAASRLLSEALALRRKQNDPLIRAALGPDAVDGVKDGRGFQQHAFAATERAIVDGTMAVMRPGAQVVNVNLDQPGFRGFGDDAVLERALEEVGENGEDAEDHKSLATDERR